MWPNNNCCYSRLQFQGAVSKWNCSVTFKVDFKVRGCVGVKLCDLVTSVTDKEHQVVTWVGNSSNGHCNSYGPKSVTFILQFVLLIVGAVWRHTRTYFDICFCTFRLTIQAKKVNMSAHEQLLIVWRMVKSSPRKFWQSFISSHDRSLGFPLSVQTSVIDR